MKKLYLFVLLAVHTSFTIAQEKTITVAEPEFINSYCILTSDSTYATLPKESGFIGKHENKTKKLSRLVGGVADLAGAAGIIGIGSGSVSGITAGVKILTTASGVSSAAQTVSALAGYEGMDIIFKGGNSPYSLKANGKDIHLIIKGEENEIDPVEIYRIVRFSASKKERRIQWFEWEPALLGSDDARKSGYINFSGKKYGKQSYLLTIPSNEIEKGEYGIFFMNIITATAIPVGTFSVK